METEGLYDCMETLAWNQSLNGNRGEEGAEARKFLRDLASRGDGRLVVKRWRTALDYFHKANPGRYPTWENWWKGTTDEWDV